MYCSIENRIESFLKKYNLLNQESSFLVGFSGGIDSMMLLDVLSKLTSQYKFSITAAHLNHNWRGLESTQEEIAAKEFCLQRNIDFYSETLSDNIPHTELDARNKRYEFFNKASILYKSTAILTGHTLTDQAETVLYRIIKGTGLNGLSGIPERRFQKNAPTIYRPILNISREENIDYCKINNLNPNIDSSNLDDKYLRNSMRLNLIPELKKYNSKVEKALIQVSKLACDSESIVNEHINSIYPQISLDNNDLITKIFVNYSTAIQKKLIINLLEKNNINYDFEKIEEIINFITTNKSSKSGNTLSLTKQKWLFVSSQIIKLIHYIKADVIKSSVLVKFNSETFCEELNKTLKITPYNKEEIITVFPKESECIAYADFSNIKTDLYLRTRQNGDKIQPLGMKEHVKLKKYFINKGVPQFERDTIPLLTTDTEVLWAAGIGISEQIKVKILPTHKIEVY